MLHAQDDTAVKPTAPIGVEPGWNGFRPLRVSAIRRESPQVMSIQLQADDRSQLPPPRPGQYLTMRVPGAAEPTPLRSYSLSGDPAAAEYRISVKCEDHGLVSQWLHAHIEPGSLVEAAAPRGDFYLTEGTDPVILISAGIGITPVLAMLHALSAAPSAREIWWLHTTRNRETQAFADEVTALIESLPHARQSIFFTQTRGRLDSSAIVALGLPPDAAAYLCGPTQFMTDMRDWLSAAGLDNANIHSELFGALPPINPGIVDGAPRRPPHPPAGTPGTGPSITFARSGLTVSWSDDYANILDLAEACDVPTRFSCRSGVCHLCETGVVAGTTTYVQMPLEPPGKSTVLICSAAPASDLVLDL
jgi:ferredoxin-NADP reductase